MYISQLGRGFDISFKEHKTVVDTKMFKFGFSQQCHNHKVLYNFKILRYVIKKKMPQVENSKIPETLQQKYYKRSMIIINNGLTTLKIVE